jgi:hypothetical protein
MASEKQPRLGVPRTTQFEPRFRLAAESRQMVSAHSRRHWLARFDSGHQEKYNPSYTALVARAKGNEPTPYAD